MTNLKKAKMAMTTKKVPAKKKPAKKLYKLNGGGNNDLTRSMRNHPTYQKPKLVLVK
jgi:hypothetical protein